MTDGFGTTITEHTLPEIKRLLRDGFVVTDENVFRLYRELLRESDAFVLDGQGEGIKSLDCVEKILSAMLERKLPRDGKLIAVGGGSVGDAAGLAAALYMRGIGWRCVPTTLLSMADSSIGGKTAVDLMGVKNIVGAFHRPVSIHLCTDFLSTLPPREISGGMGEIFKTALLDRDSMRAWRAFDGKDFMPLLKACAAFKTAVTDEDFTERGKRKILNLGHTAAHAFESADSFRLPHGQYVALGLAAESHIAQALGCIKAETAEYIKAEAAKITDLSAANRISTDKAAEAAGADKKNRGGKLTLIVCEDFSPKEIRLSQDEFERGIAQWKSTL